MAAAVATAAALPPTLVAQATALASPASFLNENKEWTLAEQLALVHAIQRFPEGDWAAVSKALRACTAHPPLSAREPSFFTPKRCETRCSDLVARHDEEDKPSRRKAPSVSFAAKLDDIAERLRQERIQELKGSIATFAEAIDKLKEQVSDIKEKDFPIAELEKMLRESHAEVNPLLQSQRKRKPDVPASRTGSTSNLLAVNPSTPRLDKPSAAVPPSVNVDTPTGKAGPVSVTDSAQAAESMPASAGGRAATRSRRGDDTTTPLEVKREPMDTEEPPPSSRRGRGAAGPAQATTPAPPAPTPTPVPTKTEEPSEEAEGEEEEETMTQKKAKMTALWKTIHKHELAQPFRKPVSTKDAPDYYTVIKQPMDLQTLKKNIDKGQYTSLAKMVKDLHLVFSNAMQYNQKGSDIFQWAKTLRDVVTNESAPLLAAARPRRGRVPAAVGVSTPPVKDERLTGRKRPAKAEPPAPDDKDSRRSKRGDNLRKKPVEEEMRTTRGMRGKRGDD